VEPHKDMIRTVPTILLDPMVASHQQAAMVANHLPVPMVVNSLIPIANLVLTTQHLNPMETMVVHPLKETMGDLLLEEIMGDKGPIMVDRAPIMVHRPLPMEVMGGKVVVITRVAVEATGVAEEAVEIDPEPILQIL